MRPNPQTSAGELLSLFSSLQRYLLALEGEHSRRRVQRERQKKVR